MKLETGKIVLRAFAKLSCPVDDIGLCVEKWKDRHPKLVWYPAFVQKRNTGPDMFKVDLGAGATVVFFRDQWGLDIH